MSSTLPRITARVDEETQQLLSQAAALAGMSSLNAFVLSAAIEKAHHLIEREQMLTLSRADAMQLVEALDRPAKAHPTLKKAASRYDEKMQ